MLCAVCGQGPCRQRFVHLGAYCSDEHKQELLRRHEANLAELLGEDAAVMPEELTEADFERLMLKLAAHLLAGMSDGMRELYRQRTPALLDPLEMASDMKALVLGALPGAHVTLKGAEGQAKLLCSGAYLFPRPLPAPLLREALGKVMLLAVLASPAYRDGPK